MLEPLEKLDERSRTSAFHVNRAVLHSLMGRSDEAREELNHARRDPQTEPILRVRMVATQLTFFTLPYGSENLDERAKRTLRSPPRYPTASASHYRRAGRPRLCLLPLDVLEGQWREVRERTVDVDWDAGRFHDAQWLRFPVAEVAAHQGDRSEFLVHLQAILPDGPTTNPGATAIIPALRLQRLSAELAIDDGDLPAARAWLEAHDRWLDWSGIVLGRADGLLAWAVYHHATGDLSTARRVAEQVLVAATTPRQPLALIAVHRFLGQLDTEAGQFDAAEEHLQESMALAEACAAPFERALTLFEIARLRLAQGRSDEARSLLAEVRDICEPLEARPTLEKVTALEQELEAPDA